MFAWLLSACSSGAQSSSHSNAEVAEGIHYTKLTQHSPAEVIHVVRVDSSLAKAKLETTREEHRRLTVSDFAQLYNCAIAVNASFFELKETATSFFEYEDSKSYLRRSETRLG